MQGGATSATQPGGNAFPYLAPPNAQLQTVADSVDLSAPPDRVWALIGPFGGTWHPLIAKIKLTGTGIGQLRTIETIDGKQIIERLEATDDARRFYRYGGITGIPAADYTGTLTAKPKGAGTTVEWRVQYLAGWTTRHCREVHRFDAAENGPWQPEVPLRRHEMSETLDILMAPSRATAGDIAVINLESTRQHAWSRFWRAPERPGLAEYIVEQEGLALTFLGDCCALDRMGVLVEQLVRMDDGAVRTLLIQAQVASATHRFVDAERYLAQARPLGAPATKVERLSLGIDQARGIRPDEVLAARRGMAAETRHLEDLVPLGALLADLRQFDEADQVYRDALRSYRDVSPFALAWVCFQLGVLWGELVPERQSARATMWYRKAIAVPPGLRESPRAYGRDLSGLWPVRRRRGPADPGDFERRS